MTPSDLTFLCVWGGEKSKGIESNFSSSTSNGKSESIFVRIEKQSLIYHVR